MFICLFVYLFICLFVYFYYVLYIMKETFKRRRCPPRCSKGSRCDRKTKKNKTRRCQPIIKKLKQTPRSNKSTPSPKKLKQTPRSNKSTPPPKMSRYAKFYNIADKVELSTKEQLKLSSKKIKEKVHNNIISELNSSNKYKIGDILFIGDDETPFAIVDEKNGKFTFAVHENPENLPFGRMLNKVKEHNVKYQKIFESELGNLRELFIPVDEEDIIDAYKNEGIY